MIKSVRIRVDHFDKDGFDEFSGWYDDDKYECVCRAWCDDEGNIFREWTATEYLTSNAKDEIVQSYPHDGELVVVEDYGHMPVRTHCVEWRKYSVIKDGKIFSTICRTYDYNKRSFINDAPKDNRYWVEDCEYDGWKYGISNKI